jgi:hypothetical protein
MTTVTVEKLRPSPAETKSLLAGDKDFLKPLVRAVLQEVVEGETTEALGASKSEQVEGQLGYRSGHYSRSLVTRFGKIELKAAGIVSGLGLGEANPIHASRRQMAGGNYSLARSAFA